MHLTLFQAALSATVGAKEKAQKKSVSEGTSVDYNVCSGCSVADASANGTCTCEGDCSGGCDICEKELHKKKMRRIEARHHICLCNHDNTSTTEKIGAMTEQCDGTSSSALAEHAAGTDVSALFV